MHWLLLTVTFALGKKQITLRGDSSLTKLEVSLKTLPSVGMKTIKVFD